MRRGALGLRGRIVGAVIVTTVATLAVAAVALLGPLEHNLRRAEFTTFQNQVKSSNAARAFQGKGVQLQQAPQAYILHVQPVPRDKRPEVREAVQHANQLALDARAAHGELVRQEQLLYARLGASEVAVLGYSASSSRPTVIARYPTGSGLGSDDSFADAVGALQQGSSRARYSIRSIDGTEYALAALPFTAAGIAGNGSSHYVLAIRRAFTEVNGAVHTVRTAFLDAALAGLALTLLLAIPLASRIVRRLRHLRQAALRLAARGPQVEFPIDRARDEVGDLARTFVLMQQQLRQQEEARRAFVATASHELRTPLTSLEGMLELLEDDLTAPSPDLEDARSLVERARAQSHRLGRLAADLLDLSRIDAQVQLRSEPVELGELSRAVLAEFELGIGERGITAELRDDNAPVWALGDPGSVARILRILLDNAVRVSPAGSRVTVALHGGDLAELTVCDEGPGVPAEERELIFQRFQRGRNTSGQAGFGLGLAIGRELAERMGGELRLAEHDGPGAVFMLRLPLAPAREQHPLAVV